MPLRGACDAQRSLDGKRLSFVIEKMHLVGIEESPICLVEQQGIVVKTVPKAPHHIDELFRPRITIGVGDVLGWTEILSVLGVTAGT